MSRGMGSYEDFLKFYLTDTDIDSCNFHDPNYLVRRRVHLASYFNIVEELQAYWITFEFPSQVFPKLFAVPDIFTLLFETCPN